METVRRGGHRAVWMKGTCHAADTFPDIHHRAGGQALISRAPARRKLRGCKRGLGESDWRVTNGDRAGMQFRVTKEHGERENAAAKSIPYQRVRVTESRDRSE